MSRLDPFDSVTTRSIFVSVVLIGIIGAIGYIAQLSAEGYFVDSDIIPRIVVTLVLFVTTVLVVYLTKYLLSKLEKTGSLTPHQKEISYRFTQFTTYIAVFIIIVAYIWDVNLSSILIGAGALGVILGFATRKILSSVVSGIIIMSTNMFRVGEWIQYNEKFGRIEKITFFHTQIRSPQGEEHIIPNDRVTSTEITNISHGRYRKDLLVGVDYQSDIKEVIDIVNNELEKLSEEDDNYISGYQPASVKDFGDSSINISVKIWLNAPTPSVINKAQTEALDKVKKRLESEDVDIPYPQRTVSYRDNG